MESLNLLDLGMLTNLVWLITAGSFYVFVSTFDDNAGRRRPVSIKHLSSNVLKKTMAGSIVGVSSVHLLQLFLHTNGDSSLSPIQKVGVMLAIHITFIFGLWIFFMTTLPEHKPEHNPEHREHDTGAPQTELATEGSHGTV
jgi:uncharacterized protein (TIGR00645 family)